MYSRAARVALLAVVAATIISAACATRINNVLADPLRYRDREVTVSGLVTDSFPLLGRGAYQIEDLLKLPLEERVYRMRCVEAWSMVIPWIGFPLAELLKKAEPTSKAKFVAFETLRRPGEMPGRPAHFGKARFQIFHGSVEHFTGHFRITHHPRRISPLHGLGIARLMIVRRKGEGNQDGRASRGRKLANGSGARAANHQIRGSEGSGHIGDKRDDFALQAGLC